MHRFLVLASLSFLLTGCGLLADLEHGPTRLKPADHGATVTYPTRVAEAPAPALEEARPVPGEVSPLPRHRPRAATARTRPETATTTPSTVAPDPPSAPVAQPPGKERAVDAPKKAKLKKCRAPGGWAIWRKKCPPPANEGVDSK